MSALSTNFPLLLLLLLMLTWRGCGYNAARLAAMRTHFPLVVVLLQSAPDIHAPTPSATNLPAAEYTRS